MIPFRGLFKNIFHLGSGEFVGRLYAVWPPLVLLGHRYGVVILGIYALAQSLTSTCSRSSTSACDRWARGCWPGILRPQATLSGEFSGGAWGRPCWSCR